MKPQIFILILALLASCKGDQQSETSTVPVETVSEIINKLQPQPYDYETNGVMCVISPDRKYLYVLEAHRERIARALNAEMVSDVQWKIQLGANEPSLAFVSVVNAPKAFAAAFPSLIAGAAVAIPGKCRTGDECQDRIALEDAMCHQHSKYLWVKETYSTRFCECDKEQKDETCFEILTRVGTEWFYGDDANCTKSTGHGEIWRGICLY